jgi:hypothetical protein
MALAGSLAALACALVSCGGHGSNTRLRLTVWDGTSGRTYTLRCDPADGTAPQPRRICAALHRHPNLLVGGPGVDHTCPLSDALRVAGTYRGYRIAASFSPCLWVPGQGGRGPTWSELLKGAADGQPATDPFPRPRLSNAERAQRAARAKRLPRLYRDELRLRRRRAVELANGTLRVVSGQKPDALALAYLRDLAAGVGLPDGPYPATAHVHSTTLRRVERIFGFATPEANSPVYVLVLGFDYRDYIGKRRSGGGATYSIIDAERLSFRGFGFLNSSPKGLGRAFALSR